VSEKIPENKYMKKRSLKERRRKIKYLFHKI
jgi:hypothetical protein